MISTIWDDVCGGVGGKLLLTRPAAAWETTKSQTLTIQSEIEIAGRHIGADHPPLVIPEVGINHAGDLAKALACVDAAVSAGAEIVKFQCHITAEEIVPNNVVPGNATESICEIIDGCTLSESEEREVQAYCLEKGVVYLSTPFSRAAADRLETMNVPAYKIGSGECNNLPLLEHIAGFGKPILFSTGMNGLDSVRRSVDVIENQGAPVALLHCTSMYPTPYDRVRLGAIQEMRDAFPAAPIGLSDHSLGNWTCFGAVALGASIVEKHFTPDMAWPGPDIEISIDPAGLRELTIGARAIWRARGGHKGVRRKNNRPSISHTPRLSQRRRSGQAKNLPERICGLSALEPVKSRPPILKI